MTTIASHLTRLFRSAIQEAFGLDIDPLVGPAQNEKFGDYQANAAMGLAKLLNEKTGQKLNPRAVAEQIKAALKLGEMASEISIAGPGFINVRLSPAWLSQRLADVATDSHLGIERANPPETVVVDYSGPNVAKEMHVGHLRSTIIGDAISRVLEFQGHRIIRQNHIGDWGTQFGRVVLAIWFRIVSEAVGLPDLTRLQIASWAKATEDKTPNANVTLKARLVAEFAGFDQRFIESDPDGTKYFESGLERLALPLSELEQLYQFVSGIMDDASARQHRVYHPRLGWQILDELPRLTTTFIQNPDLPANRQEKLAWQQATRITLAACNEIYARLDVRLAHPQSQDQPLVRGESFYNPYLSAVIADLTRANVATVSEGAVVIFAEGYKDPLVIQKSGGGFLYGTTDLAAIRFRINDLRAQRIIYTHDSRQALHFTLVFDAARRAGWAENVSLEYAPFGTMLGEDGKPFKTRSGGTVKLKDLLDEAEERAFKVVTEKSPALPEDQRRQIAHAIGIGAVKYADLSKDRVSDYIFSFDKMLSLDGNTGPYLQYAYARIRSIFRKAEERGINGHVNGVRVLLDSPFELALAKHILRFGEVIELVARELKPHHLCTYLYELSAKFSGFFENCPVVQSEDPMRSSRLALCDLTARVLACGLDLLGIAHPPQM